MPYGNMVLKADKWIFFIIIADGQVRREAQQRRSGAAWRVQQFASQIVRVVADGRDVARALCAAADLIRAGTGLAVR